MRAYAQRLKKSSPRRHAKTHQDVFVCLDSPSRDFAEVFKHHAASGRGNMTLFSNRPFNFLQGGGRLAPPAPRCCGEWFW